jgi:hypothetical protein
MVTLHAAAIPRMRMDREPHIGEYVAKTNAICDCSQIPAAPESSQKQACNDDRRMLPY